MSTSLAISALLAAVLACISFLAGTTYTDRARDRSYRRLVEERRELNAMLLHSLGSRTTSPYGPFPVGASRRATLLQPLCDQGIDDD